MLNLIYKNCIAIDNQEITPSHNFPIASGQIPLPKPFQRLTDFQK